MIDIVFELFRKLSAYSLPKLQLVQVDDDGDNIDGQPSFPRPPRGYCIVEKGDEQPVALIKLRSMTKCLSFSVFSSRVFLIRNCVATRGGNSRRYVLLISLVVFYAVLIRTGIDMLL